MAMCLAVFHRKERLHLISAFENGQAAVHQLQNDGGWTLVYRTQAHSQPILSLDVLPDLDFFLTSGADAIIAKHPIPDEPQELVPEFDPSKRIIEEITDEPKSLLSQGLAGQPKSTTEARTFQEWKHPTKTINTKHSGQQSLHVRSDGAIFATAGWDSKMRIYSTKTLKELAVLKWHNEGAYAISFSTIEPAKKGLDVTRMSVSARRSHRAKVAHWVAGGAKDGKVSLWDVY